MAIFLNLSPNSNHLHPLQAENCGRNSRLVVDEDDNGKLRLEMVNTCLTEVFIIMYSVLTLVLLNTTTVVFNMFIMSYFKVK